MKRSVRLAGHLTSVSIEAPFWRELRRMADEAGLPVGRLVERIDGARGEANLSSALRLAVLADLIAQRGGDAGAAAISES